jgi:hypothetical protein
MNKKKLNQTFLTTYEKFDTVCNQRFDLTTGGATEYINRLNNARFAPGRDDILPRLVNYRTTRNNFAADPALVKKSADLTKDDLTWMRDFVRDLEKEKDPISVYLKKARKYVRSRKTKKVLAVVGIIVLVAAAVGAAAFFLL